MLAGAAKAVRTPVAWLEIIYYVESNLYHWHDNKLRNPLQWVQQERNLATVPAGYKYLALIIRIDSADQIPHHNPMLMA